jgi:hypothetical protein
MYDHERIPHDELMYKMINSIAKEGKDSFGYPNGRFYVPKDAAIKFVTPLVKELVKFKDAAEFDFYVKDAVSDLFDHIDVLNTGFIEIEQMGRFIKESCKNHTL